MNEFDRLKEENQRLKDLIAHLSETLIITRNIDAQTGHLHEPS